MEIKIFCPLWGSEQVPLKEFFRNVKEAGYDGVDTWLPDTSEERRHFLDELQKCELLLISHQHQATGNTIDEYLESYQHYLSICSDGNPVLINSHSGRDYFHFEDQKKIIDSAFEFSQNTALKYSMRLTGEGSDTARRRPRRFLKCTLK